MKYALIISLLTFFLVVNARAQIRPLTYFDHMDKYDVIGDIQLNRAKDFFGCDSTILKQYLDNDSVYIVRIIICIPKFRDEHLVQFDKDISTMLTPESEQYSFWRKGKNKDTLLLTVNNCRTIYGFNMSISCNPGEILERKYYEVLSALKVHNIQLNDICIYLINSAVENVNQVYIEKNGVSYFIENGKLINAMDYFKSKYTIEQLRNRMGYRVIR